MLDAAAGPDTVHIASDQPASSAIRGANEAEGIIKESWKDMHEKPLHSSRLHYFVPQLRNVHSNILAALFL